MLKKIVFALILCGLAVAPALADHRRVAGSLSVGGLYFEIVHDPYRPVGSYLRVAGTLDHGPSCSRSCYRNRGHDYHHQSCPALRGHFADYRPDLLVVLGKPYHRGRYYGDHGHHRRERYRDDERYDYDDERYDDEYNDDGGKHRHKHRHHRH